MNSVPILTHSFQQFPDLNYLQKYLIQTVPLSELQKSVKRKRNGAAPGFNSPTYVPYKKCVSLLKFVFKLGRKIWKTRDIPSEWALAYIILLSKSSDLSAVSEFRPIAITCTVGKIFFSVLLSFCTYTVLFLFISPPKNIINISNTNQK